MPKYRVEMRLEYSQWAFVEAEDDEQAYQAVVNAAETGDFEAHGVDVDSPEYAAHIGQDTWIVEAIDEEEDEA